MGISDQALLLISFVLLITMLIVAGQSTRLNRDLHGRRGGALANIIMVIVWAELLAQTFSFINALLISVDRMATVETRIYFFLANQIVSVTVIVWAFLKVRGLKQYD